MTTYSKNGIYFHIKENHVEGTAISFRFLVGMPYEEARLVRMMADNGAIMFSTGSREMLDMKYVGPDSDWDLCFLDVVYDKPIRRKELPLKMEPFGSGGSTMYGKLNLIKLNTWKFERWLMATRLLRDTEVAKSKLKRVNFFRRMCGESQLVPGDQKHEALATHDRHQEWLRQRQMQPQVLASTR